VVCVPVAAGTVCALSQGVVNVEHTSTEADVIEHVIEGLRLPFSRLSSGDVVCVEFDLKPWLAGFVTAALEIPAQEDEEDTEPSVSRQTRR
jgi:hypothetical protein